jgi:NADPH:quinone reductase-like Zn-dependent oxidoreductase
MKAVRIHEYGAPDTLRFEDAPCPEPHAGEALIRVEATSVNPFDCAMRAGYVRSYFELPMPYIPGLDVAGVIEGLGEGVSGFKTGDRVFARGGLMRDGTNAELAVVPDSDMALMPASLDPIHAAALPHVCLTAWQALFELAQLGAGQTVLIHGAGGGVGHVAAQLAKERGATVIGTTSRNSDLLLEMSCDSIVDYTAEPFEAAAKDVDVVLDTVGGETQERSWSVLKPGGILVSLIQQPSPEAAAAHGVRQAMVYSAPPIGPTLAEVARLVEAGKLRPIVSEVMPLSDIRRAHEMIEARHTRGKIVLQVH